MKREEILAKIHAYICSDGIIDRYTSKGMNGKKFRIRRLLRVRFYNGNIRIIEDFISSVRKLYPNHKYIRYVAKRSEVEIRGQIISKGILKLGNTSTRNWRMPMNLSKKQQAIWIKAFADCDGTIQNRNYDRFIAIDPINKIGLGDIPEALNKFKILNKVYIIQVGKHFRIKIFRKENLLEYQKQINFKHPEKRSKLMGAIKSYK